MLLDMRQALRCHAEIEEERAPVPRAGRSRI